MIIEVICQLIGFIQRKKKKTFLLMLTIQRWPPFLWERYSCIIQLTKGLCSFQSNLLNFKEDNALKNLSFLKYILWEKEGESNLFPYFQQGKYASYFTLNFPLPLRDREDWSCAATYQASPAEARNWNRQGRNIAQRLWREHGPTNILSWEF